MNNSESCCVFFIEEYEATLASYRGDFVQIFTAVYIIAALS